MTYELNNIVFTDLYTLGADIYKFPHEFNIAFKKDPNILEFIKAQDPEKFQAILDLLADRYIPDAFLFYAALVLNSHQKLSYHKYQFNNYQEIGTAIISFSPKIDIYLMDLLNFGFIKEYMELQQDNKRMPKLYDKVAELTNDCRKNKNLAYFRLGFFLYGTQNVFYNHHRYKDLNSFLSEYMSTTGLIKLASNFDDNCFLYAWSIETKGDTSMYERYLKNIEILEQKEALLEIEKRREE